MYPKQKSSRSMFFIGKIYKSCIKKKETRAISEMNVNSRKRTFLKSSDAFFILSIDGDTYTAIQNIFFSGIVFFSCL